MSSASSAQAAMQLPPDHGQSRLRPGDGLLGPELSLGVSGRSQKTLGYRPVGPGIEPVVLQHIEEMGPGHRGPVCTISLPLFLWLLRCERRRSLL